MSRQINQPVGQIKLTNVAVVRMNKGGKRFEIACYRNKVIDYRQGVEQDLSEVLQTDRVFTNVSKGEFAKAKDLQKVFGTKDEEEIAKLILVKGQLQVSDKERTQQLEKTSAQIAEWVSKNCVHPESDRPYTISQIRHAMQQANFSVHPTKPLKRQYLDCVKLLQNVMPIQRAKMELLLLVPPGKAKDEIETALQEHQVKFVVSQERHDGTDGTDGTSTTALYKYPILVDPSLYRVLNDIVQNVGGDTARIEIINQVVTKQGDVNFLEAEMGQTMIQTTDTGQDDNDSGEESADVDHVTNILSQARINDDGHDDNDDDGSDQSDEENSDDNNFSMTKSRRKAQKKAKKKNQKAQRRTVEHDDPSTITSTSQQQQINKGPLESSSSGPTAESSSSQTGRSGGADSASGRKSCNTCGGFFDSPADFRAHFKSDWHRFNQKLKMKGAAPISEKEFLLCDSDTFFTGSGDDLLL
mmetsp:Transcript_23320/g.41364  ORF Transcript_23320/g.41364 Transcript_23320/m.41364 type:complete len:470 (+) Transcript_23320:58-1467(+)